MYHYLHHEDLRKSKYNKSLIKIEGSIHKLGLEGSSTKLGPYANLSESIARITRNQDTSTIVVLGNDKLFFESVNELVKHDRSLAIGYIPIFGESNLTKSLGIPMEDEAVSVLAKRRVTNLRLAEVGSLVFLDSIFVPYQKISLQLDHELIIDTPKGHETVIYNLPDAGVDKNILSSISPHDNTLSIGFVPQSSFFLKKVQTINPTSLFHAKHIKVICKSGSARAVVDGFKTIKTPINIGVSDKKLSLIVGKTRVI